MFSALRNFALPALKYFGSQLVSWGINKFLGSAPAQRIIPNQLKPLVSDTVHSIYDNTLGQWKRPQPIPQQQWQDIQNQYNQHKLRPMNRKPRKRFKR